MVKQVKYGVISDIHLDPEIIIPTLNILKEKEIDRLLVNGDIGGNYGTLEQSQIYTATILEHIGKSGLETFVQPGSHETLGAYQPVMDYFASKYSNIQDAIKNRKIDFKDHHLVFLPGSDFVSGGEYRIISKDSDLEPGLYNSERGPVHLANPKDLRKIVTAPEKTILVCHVPRKFNGIENCVDVAYFAEDKEGMIIPGKTIENKIVSKYGNLSSEQIRKIALEEGFRLRTENRGNRDLSEIYEELGINKAVSGHFHESSHRANDRASKFVEEGKLTNELFWNSGHLDNGYCGILTVNGDLVSYENIDLRNYLK